MIVGRPATRTGTDGTQTRPACFPMETPDRRYRLTRRQRLRGRRAFSCIFNKGLRKSAGPIAVIALPNHCGTCRLGLAVSRRVGNAATRNHIKRLIREAFRLQQHDWPRSYDLVVVVRPHKPAGLADYQRMLFGAIRSVHLAWQRRGRRTRKESGDAPGA